MTTHNRVQDMHTAVTRATPAEARYNHLLTRAAFDLSLLRDAAFIADVPLPHLAKIHRLRRELFKLLRDTEEQKRQFEQEQEKEN